MRYIETNRLARLGPKENVVQIVPTKDSVRPSVLRIADGSDHDLVSRPLSAPTGPHGAAGFCNRAGSTIARPEVTNVYLGPFWGDRDKVEEFSRAIVENGYLDPLRELGYGTGSGIYLGPTAGPELTAGDLFADADARRLIGDMLKQGRLHANENSLLVLILPDQVTAVLDGDRSCEKFCGYHDALPFNGTDVAYAVLPSSLCHGCGGEFGDFTAVYAHEIAEACTDKVPGRGWVADDGQENADLEAWILFGWGPPGDPKRYTIQGYYTNERGNTIGAWRETRRTAVATIENRVIAVVENWSQEGVSNPAVGLKELWDAQHATTAPYDPVGINSLCPSVIAAIPEKRLDSVVTPPRLRSRSIVTVDGLIDEVINARGR